jgi:putative FmdB family regulatory protein
VPIYEFRCEACEARFEALVPAGTESAPCPECAAERTRRVYSAQAPAAQLVKPPGERRKQERANARLHEKTKSNFKQARQRAQQRQARGKDRGGP